MVDAGRAQVDHRCVALDHVGCGWSDKPDEGRYTYTLRSRADDLARLVEHLGLDRVNLAVHDWGGMIGLSWAVRNPERIARLVILNTGAFPLPTSLRLRFTVAQHRWKDSNLHSSP